MIGIIGAMEEEVEAIKVLMEDIEEKQIRHTHFYVGKLSSQDVCLMQSGIGKINAAVSTTLLLEHFPIDALLNVGSAGGLMMDENVGDVVIGKQVCHHDVDVTAFGRAYGEVPGMPLYFEADEHLIALTTHALKDLNIPSHVGLIVSGDSFIATKEQVSPILSHFPSALAAEMEASSIAQVAYIYHKPFIILRSLSDVFGKGNNNIQFDEYLKTAAKHSAALCQAVVSHYEC